ncbi:MAG: di-trans,poly-cis-decaprenylcistransferase [Clostridiales bacterium]|nr:di-trans,poly-cis-decaprenylcistransferase [Clostridiales bacterium]
MKSSKKDSATFTAPYHVGMIMDGNRRWARKRLLPRAAGHRAGAKNVVPIVSCAFDCGVKIVTLYVFSTENAGRSEDEVNALIDLIRDQAKPMADKLIEIGARVGYSGDRSYFPQDIRDIMDEVESRNTNPDAPLVNMAMNYSGRSEIVRACALAAQSGSVTQESIERNLYTAGLPDPDMIIRTGGEKRLSNFMLYQAAYSELFFTDTLWPDFDTDELKSMFEEYSHRTRRIGR